MTNIRYARYIRLWKLIITKPMKDYLIISLQWQKNLLVELISSTLHRLRLTKSSSTSLTILSSPWRKKECKKQRKGLLYSFEKKILLSRAEQYSVRSRLLKVLRSYVEDSNAGKGRAEGSRDELEKVSNIEILKKGKFLLMAKWWACKRFCTLKYWKGKVVKHA